jgi:hypothetical protein
MENFADRRAFPRQDLLVSVRPPGETSSEGWLSTRDVSAGGMRLLSARPLAKGDRFELEMLLPDGSWLLVLTKVAWSVTLDVGSSAKFEVGLRFLELSEDDLERLRPLLPAPAPGAHVDGGRRDL